MVALAIACVIAQPEAANPRPAANPPQRITLTDGSVLRGHVQGMAIDFRTTHGTLKIPLADVRQLEFGFRFAPGQEQQIVALGNKLGHKDYKVRDEADRALRAIGSAVVPVLGGEWAFQASPEASTRAMSILAAVGQPRAKGDTIDATDCRCKGRVQGDAIVIVSPLLGKLEIPCASIRSVQFLRSTEIQLDAQTYGSPGDERWHDTGLTGSLSLTAEGQVDLFPSTPGMYMCDPEGYNTTGKGSAFKAGSLIGRWGRYGREFHVGSRWSGNSRVGNLFLRVCPSPWNNESAGIYRVLVRAE